MTKKIFPKIFSREISEGPVEAGQTFGMTPDAVAEKYFSNRNEILSLLRFYSNLRISDVANQLGISEKELEEAEKSNRLVPFQWVPGIAKIFNVDLKILLLLLGHAQSRDNDGTLREIAALPMAAQYSGPELTTQEKVDIEELFRMIIKNLKDKQKNE